MEQTTPISLQMHPSHSVLGPIQVYNVANVQMKHHLVKLNILYKLGIEHKRLGTFSHSDCDPIGHIWCHCHTCPFEGDSMKAKLKGII